MKFSEIKSKRSELSNSAEFVTWLSQNVKINRYVPIIDKYARIKTFSTMFMDEFLDKLVFHNGDTDNEYVYMRYDILTMFNILFSYTDIEVSIKDVVSENYDFVKTSGLYDYIMKLCGNDYVEFKNMCDRAIGINDLSIISKISDIFDENLNTEAMKDNLDGLNRLMKSKKFNNMMDRINNIELANNGTLQKVISIVDKLKENNPIQE